MCEKSFLMSYSLYADVQFRVPLRPLLRPSNHVLGALGPGQIIVESNHQPMIRSRASAENLQHLLIPNRPSSSVITIPVCVFYDASPESQRLSSLVRQGVRPRSTSSYYHRG